MKPSEDYAGLVEALRRKSKRYSAEEDAADALEAVLAERDAVIREKGERK